MCSSISNRDPNTAPSLARYTQVGALTNHLVRNRPAAAREIALLTHALWHRNNLADYILRTWTPRCKCRTANSRSQSTFDVASTASLTRANPMRSCSSRT